jgi:hypothetical protein
MVLELLDQPGTQGVPENVANYGRERVVVSQNMRVIVLLPLPASCATSMDESRVLFEGCDEPPEVGIGSRAGDDQVEAVGHEAVCRYFEPKCVRGTQKLIANAIDSVRFRESSMTVLGADREEIRVLSEVIEVPEATGMHPVHPGIRKGVADPRRP